MDINLKALMALRAVMAEGTVTAAADYLHRTQPVVSRLIAQLEASAGFAMFRRDRQRLIPTAEGIAFYREAERVVAALSEVEASAENIRARRPLPLRIMAQSHVAHCLLDEALAGFCEKHPDFRFSLEIRQREYISHWVANRQFDVGFAPMPMGHPQLEAMPLIRAPVYAVLPSGHRLSRKRRLSVADLVSESIVAARPGVPMRTRMDGWFGIRSGVAKIRGETASVLSACQLTARGMGPTFADPFAASRFISEGAVVIRPLSPALSVDYVVLRREGEQPGALADEFVKAVRSTAKKLAAQAARASEMM